MIKINKKIVCGILSVVMVFSLAACGNKTKMNEDITTHVNSNKEILKNLVSSIDREMDNLLSIDALDKYSEVGVLNGETLYAVNSITYTNFVRRFMNRMEPNVIEQELYVRGYYTASNNILFTTNSQFFKKDKLATSDFTYYKDIDKDTAFHMVPDLEEKIKEFEKRGFEDFSFYKMMVTGAEKQSDLETEDFYEVLYLLGKENDSYKILDSYYYMQGNSKYNKNKPYIDVSGIENFSPLIIEGGKVINRPEENQKTSEIVENIETVENAIAEE